MRIIRALATTFALVVLGDSAASAQCTAETEQGRRIVTEFATQHSPASRPASVPVVDASQIRLLTDASDSALCQQLFDRYTAQRQDPASPPTDRRWTFYQVGTLYYVVVTRISPPVQHTSEGVRLRLGWTPILIFNSNLEHVATVGR